MALGYTFVQTCGQLQQILDEINKKDGGKSEWD
jgi:hypothetical protein